MGGPTGSTPNSSGFYPIPHFFSKWIDEVIGSGWCGPVLEHSSLDVLGLGMVFPNQTSLLHGHGLELGGLYQCVTKLCGKLVF